MDEENPNPISTMNKQEIAIYNILSLFYREQSNSLIQLIALIGCLYRQGGLLWSQSTAPAVDMILFAGNLITVRV